MADRWHPKDRRKIRRSLEIWLQTGKPASHVYQEQLKTTSQDDSFPPAEHFESSVLDDHLVFWTHASARELHPRLDRRVDEMISRGLVEEVKSMHEFSQESRTQGLTVDQGRGIWIAIGYKELLPFLSHPKPSTTDKVQCVERIKLSTRQYAKRQSRWMRLRMLPALRQVRKDGFLFLLDASDPSTWSSTVEALAIDILRKFLDGRRLPMPDSLSQLARESLVVEEKPAMLAQYCEACDKTLMCEAEWTQHLKGRGHRKATQPRNSHHSQFLKVGDP
ncbi:uncharacterized protein KY384_003676 [Bacidia gigantensis]|uniref:uncharacterized protein n=1 Tax=Bacidia gigantensis TaxID=2732470 RepID=UPI001D05381C|nr:uncharacterized protein KY384_003676 [Bacidia gigantensis]KAG8532039.1 hypothetical protein KY384_003676 [Bacidia gigantensis]